MSSFGKVGTGFSKFGATGFGSKCICNESDIKKDRKVKFFSEVQIPDHLKKFVDVENLIYNLTEEKFDETIKFISDNFKDDETNYVFRVIVHFFSIIPKKKALYTEFYAVLAMTRPNFMPRPGELLDINRDFLRRICNLGVFSPGDKIIGQEGRSSFGFGGGGIRSNETIENYFEHRNNDEMFNVSSSIRQRAYEAVREDNITELQKIAASPDFKWENFKSDDNRPRKLGLEIGSGDLIGTAAQYAAIQCFKYLVLNGLDASKCGSDAIRGGNLEIISICSQKNANFNRCLVDAVQHYHFDVADFLIKGEYNNDFYDTSDFTNRIKTTIPYLYLKQNDLLGSSNRIIRNACSNNLDNVITDCLIEGCRVDSDCLEYVIRNGNISLIEKLLPYVDRIPDSCLTTSINQGNYEITKYLFEKGAAVPNYNRINYMRSGDVKFIKLLIEHGLVIKDPESGYGEDPRLIQAIRAGDLELVKFVYEQLPNLKVYDRRGRQPLYYALEKSPQIVYFLLEKGADISITESYDNDCITNIETVKVILENGGKFNDRTLRDICNRLVMRNDVEGLKYMKSKGCKLTNGMLLNNMNRRISDEMYNFMFDEMKDLNIEGLALTTIQNDSIETFKKLLSKGLNINKPVSEGFVRGRCSGTCTTLGGLRTCGPAENLEGFKYVYLLSYALKHCNDTFIKLLLDNGALPDVPYEDKSLDEGTRNRIKNAKLPIFVALRRDPSTFQMLFDKCTHIKEITPKIFEYIERKPHRVMDKLDIIFAKVGTSDLKGMSNNVLYYALDNGSEELAISLIKKGVDITTPLKGGRREKTALKIACRRGYTDAVKLILEKGADPNREEPEGKKSPLSAAVRRNNLEIVKILVDKGAKINAHSGKFDKTPIIEAYRAQKEIIEYLVSKGADINAEDKFKRTVGFYVDDAERMKVLIDNGLDVNHRDDQGKTILHRICNQANFIDRRNNGPNNQTSPSYQMAKLLLENGADANIRDEPKTPVELITNQQDKESIQSYFKDHKAKK